MAEDRNRNDRFEGENMIQDNDHLGDAGQVGGQNRGRGGQSEQSQTDARQQGDAQNSGAQQGGQSQKRRGKAK